MTASLRSRVERLRRDFAEVAAQRAKPAEQLARDELRAQAERLREIARACSAAAQLIDRAAEGIEPC